MARIGPAHADRLDDSRVDGLDDRHAGEACDPLSAGVPESYRDYAEQMSLELVADCGHFISEERPDVLVDRLLEFFDTPSEQAGCGASKRLEEEAGHDR